MSSNHHDILNSYAVVSVATACAIIGGDGVPVSPGTVYRLCRAGALERRGKGKITTASIRRYLEEGLCHGDGAAPRAQAASTRPRTAGAPSASCRAARTANDGTSGASSPPEWERLIRFPRGSASE